MVWYVGELYVFQYVVCDGLVQFYGEIVFGNLVVVLIYLQVEVVGFGCLDQGQCLCMVMQEVVGYVVFIEWFDVDVQVCSGGVCVGLVQIC